MKALNQTLGLVLGLLMLAALWLVATMLPGLVCTGWETIDPPPTGTEG